ncbi:hypothetical protein [Pararhodobacter zhoushanensis]|uniref:Uncharacterized protein n=1 Tax=Pararhodobacter zhoushanensis TaxID=2479545 RepID=A0ABT3H4A9_9RHOB|nr:hypothetical protein [Pararhodobacter zhoushanensis]MCW1934558.1 hypothetical protein [Pararhodobacter zhoushanensis]
MTNRIDLQTILADPAATARWISWRVKLHEARHQNAARFVFCSTQGAAQ